MNFSKRYKIALAFSFILIILVSLFCEHCFYNLSVILGFIGLVYFSIKSFVIFVKTIIEETTGNGDYIIPILGLAYAVFSIIFISLFIFHSKELSNLVIESFGSSMKWEFARRMVRASVYVVVIAFVWNFSKAFYTLNSVEFGELNSQSVSLRSQNESQDQIFNNRLSLILKSLIEVIIRILIAGLFIYIEKHLENVQSIEKMEDLSVYITFLYFGLLVWIFWFSYVFDKPSIEIKTAMVWQFSLGLLMGLLVLCVSIGEYKWFPFYNIEYNSILGSICYFIPAFLICSFIIYIEIITWKDFLKSLSVSETPANVN